MTFQFSNNATTTLAADITNAATTLAVAAGKGALFPSPSGANVFRATLVRASDGAVEIVEVTARSTDTLTVTRAQEGTTALAFVTGDTVALRVTAAALNGFAQGALEVNTHAATSKATPADADEIPTSDSAASFGLKKFTWANLKAAMLSYIVATVNTWTKAQIGSPVALSVSSNAVAVDLSLGNNFTLSLQATTGQTLSNPTNVTAGQSGNIVITQNATPSTLAYGSYWKSVDGTTPTVSTTANAVNVLSYYVVSSTYIMFQLNKNGVA